MAEVLDVEIQKQESKRYDERFLVHIITENFFWEIVYHVDGSNADYTWTCSTYGHLHARASGMMEIENAFQEVFTHALDVVSRYEPGIVELTE